MWHDKSGLCSFVHIVGIRIWVMLSVGCAVLCILCLVQGIRCGQVKCEVNICVHIVWGSGC